MEKNSDSEKTTDDIKSSHGNTSPMKMEEVVEDTPPREVVNDSSSVSSGFNVYEKTKPPGSFPLYRDTALPLFNHLKAPFLRDIKENPSPKKTVVSFLPSVVVSIGEHHHLISSGGSASSLPTLSDQAAELLAVTVELRLRLLIQTVFQFATHYVGSRAEGGLVRFAHVVDALELYQVKMKKKSHHILAAGSSIESSKYGTAVDTPITPLTPYFTPSLFLSHWNHSTLPCTDRSSLVTVSTEEFSSESSLEHLNPQLPTLTIQWIAVEGRLVDAFPIEHPLYYSSSPPPDQEAFLLSHYKISWRPYERKPKNVKRHENLTPHAHPQDNSSFSTLGLVGQTEKIHHNLSREHYILLNKLREIFRKPFVDSTTEFSRPVLQSLLAAETSPGLRQLVPYIIHFACQQIYLPLASPSLFPTSSAGLRTILRLIIALLRNPSLRLQYFVHQIVQAVQTIVLHPFLGCKELTVGSSIALRHAAAATLSYMASHFASLHGPGIGGFVGRTIVAVYHSALDVDQPIPTLLGAIIGLRCLGPRALQIVLLPKLPALVELLVLSTHGTHSISSPLRYTIHQFRLSLLLEVLSAMTDILSVVAPSSCSLDGEDFLSLILPHHTGVLETLKQSFEKVSETFGDTLTPYLSAAILRHEDPTDSTFSSPSRVTPTQDTCSCADTFLAVL